MESRTPEGSKLNRSKSMAPAVAALTVGLVLSIAAPVHATTTDVASEPTFEEVESDALAIYDVLAESADPEAAYANLSSEDLATLQSYFFVDEVTETISLTPEEAAPGTQPTTYTSMKAAEAAVAAAAKCYTGWAKFTGTAALGNGIWDVWVEGRWCGTPGSKVTSAAFLRSWSTIAAVGWRDGGLIASGKGITTNGLARIWAQRKMIFGTGGWDVQEARPCVRLTGYSDGYHVGGATCSVA